MPDHDRQFLTTTLVEGLGTLRGRFGKRERAARMTALDRCVAARPRSVRALASYHDELLFLVAYPDDKEVLRRAEAELERVAAAARSLVTDDITRLANSGIAGTTIDCGFAYETLCWLTRRFGSSITLDRAAAGKSELLGDLLSVLASPMERDGLCGDMRAAKWIELASGRALTDSLPWILDRLGTLDLTPEVREHVFEALRLRVRWTLDDPQGSVTFARFPPRPLFYQGRRPPRRPDVRRLTRRTLPATPVSSPAAAERLIDAARCSLLTRRRETDPVVYANPREVTLLSLERGVDVALFGLETERRMSLESYFGYVIARNRVPVGYGGAWVILDQAEIGINVFDAFRGGESAYLMAQLLRVYHHYYGVQRFHVDPYQFGARNPEAIRSGAYWFYHRFGFRSLDPALRDLADHESERRRRDTAYRSPAPTLRRLARAPLVLSFESAAAARSPRITPASVALAVSRRAADRFDGDRTAAEGWAQRRVANLLGPLDRRRWPADERRWFDRLSLLAACFDDLGDWSRADRKALTWVMRRKGGPRERGHLLATQRHPRLRAALTALIS